MRTAAFALIVSLLATAVAAVDLSFFEATCADIGFKKKTPAFGECVLELHSRATKGTQPAQASGKASVTTPDRAASAVPTNLTEDEQRCVQYGFTYGTADFAGCRQRFVLARQELQQRQLEYQRSVQQYEAEKRRYEEQVAEYKRQREVEKNLKIMQFGLAMMAGRSPNAIENIANASAATFGTPPVPPRAPEPSTFVITSPRGARHCTVMGNVVSCN